MLIEINENNVLPKEINLVDLNYIYDSNNKLILTDGKTFKLDINEFGAFR